MNCSLVPFAMLGFAGVTAMDTNVADVTDRVVLPEMLPLVAEMLVPPAEAEVASPCEPAALLMVAVPVLEEDQITCVVRLRVELSE